MQFRWFWTAAAAIHLSNCLVASRSTLPVIHNSRTDTVLSITDSRIERRALSDFPNDGITPSRAIVSEIEAACVQRLLDLKGLASSPTGMSVCYDVSSLDKTTGEFISQIYLYQVSPATGNWTNIDPTSLNVNIAYPRANLTQSSLNQQARRLIPRTGLQKRGSHPVLVTSQTFRGRVLIDWDPTDENKEMIALEPIVTVTARTGSTPQNPIRDVLSTKEAAFVNGAFAQKAAAAAAAAAASASATPFVLPGTRPNPEISIVGPILTGVWVLLFVATVGAGTMERLKFRNSYRRKARYNAWTGGANTAPRTIVGYERR